MTNSTNIRIAVRGTYDIQKLRIQIGNRMVCNYKAKLGQKPSEREDTLDSEGKIILKALRASFKRLTDGIATFPRKKGFKGDELISDYTELCLIAGYLDLEEMEQQHFRRLGNILEDYPIYVQFLKNVKGIGPAMAGVLISEFDIRKARYPSSLWKYCGLDVGPDGKGRSVRAEHLIDVEYTAKDGTKKTKKSITHNKWLKSKLTGVLGPSFIKVGVDNSPYAVMYYDYKNRMENHAIYGIHNDGVDDPNAPLTKDGKSQKITSKLRRHRQAIRYIIKRFLVDLHPVWRTMEGLPVSLEYSEAKLGRRHSA